MDLTGPVPYRPNTLPPMPSVLVVDDNEGTRNALRLLLGRSGCDPAWVASGADALELLQHLTFDAVVLDWMMPGMDGLEVLRRLRGDPATAHVRVIVYSAAEDPRMEREAAALGAAGMVLKSGGFSVLYERVRQVLPPSDSAM